MYQRNDVSAAFAVKKIFSDNGAEGLAFIHSKKEDNIDSVHDSIYAQVSDCRKDGKNDSSTESMDMFNRMPRWLSKALVKLVCVLDRHGKVPGPFIATDPYYASVILSNLGSIKLHSGYHHLTNWGTNSFFILVGENHLHPFYDENGNITMKNALELGLTIDERIADGTYFAKSIRLLRKLLQNPELLELPLQTEIEID